MFTQRFRLFFYSSGYLALYTGFLLIFFMARPADFYPTLRHLLLKSHIVTVVLWLFTCGMLFSIHVIPQLQARIQEGRKTGIVLIGLIALMSFSGFACKSYRQLRRWITHAGCTLLPARRLPHCC